MYDWLDISLNILKFLLLVLHSIWDLDELNIWFDLNKLGNTPNLTNALTINEPWMYDV